MIVLPFVLSPWESRLSYNIPQYFNGADSLAAVCTAFFIRQDITIFSVKLCEIPANKLCVFGRNSAETSF